MSDASRDPQAADDSLGETRRYIIYGGSGGIGSETARILREEDADVHLVARDVDRLSETATAIGATYTAGDVADPDLPARVAEDVGAPCDGLAYAVGTINLRSLRGLRETDFLNDLRINAVGAALAVQGMLPLLRKGSFPASVVLFSSVAASQGFAMHASMGMAKAAVNGLTLSLAAELAPRVRVNAIAPSLTRTPLAEAVVPNEKIATAIADMHPMQRLGQPQDIARLAAFLLSDKADWMTGQIIGLDGGRSTLRNRN